MSRKKSSIDKDMQMFKERGFGKLLGLGNSPCLLIIDIIKGFTDASMPMGSDLSTQIEATNKVLETARQYNIPVIFTTISYDDNDSGIWFQKMEGLLTLKAGTKAVELDDRLNYRNEDALIIKKYASAFFGTDLSSRLNAQNIDTVIVFGCTTSGCVRATVVDAVQLAYRPIVIQDAVGDRSNASHEQSLFDMEQKYADVMDSEKIIKLIRKNYSADIQNTPQIL